MKQEDTKSTGKEQLIYDAASEAVLESRIEISKLLSKEDWERVDEVLHKAMRNAGDWAVKAHRADARMVKTARQLLNKAQD